MSTYVLYEGDGSQLNYTFSFPYLSTNHIQVFLNDQLQLKGMHYSLNGSTVTFQDAPGAGDAIEIRRQTSPNDELVEFVDGSQLRGSELNTGYLHNFYLSQEYRDHFTRLITDALIGIADGSAITATEPDEVIAVIVNDMINSAAAFTLQERISDIDANAEAIVTLGESLQVQVNTLAQGTAALVFVQAEEPVPGVGNVPDPIPDGARWYDSDDNNKPYIYDADALEWVSIADPRIGQAAAAVSVLQVNVGDNYSAIVNEQLVRSQADSALASTLALIGVQSSDQSAFIIDSDTVKLDTETGDTLANRFSQISADIANGDSANSAEVTSEQTARVNADNALAGDITLVNARIDVTETDINGVEQDVATVAADVLTEQSARVSQDNALASNISAVQASLETKEDDLYASIATEQSARVSQDNALSSSIASLTASVNGNSSTINTVQQAVANNDDDITTLYAKYGVTLNVNGYVTGFAQHNDGTSGAFVILADKFAVVDPSGDPGEAEYVPFEIVNGKINMRGVVQIDGDLVVNGTLNGYKIVSGGIGTTQLANSAVTVDKLSANSITAVKIQANAITADKLNVSSLSAITANIGTLTMGTTGYIRGGATGYMNGAGFYMGYSSGYKFHIGNPSSGNYMAWDGSTLTVKGDLVVGDYAASDTVLASANTARSNANASWSEEKAFKIDRNGSVKIKALVKRGTGTVVSYPRYRVLRGGTVVAGPFNITSTSYTAISHTVSSITADQEVSIQLIGGTYDEPGVGTLPMFGYVDNAQICADVVFGNGITVTNS